MKRTWCHILFFILLLDYTSLGQLLKAPILVAHFMEHHQLDHSIGIMKFLSMHYWGEDLDDDDDATDAKLPFKKVDFTNAYPLAFSFTKPPKAQRPVEYLSVSEPGYIDTWIPHPPLASPFRPPKA